MFYKDSEFYTNYSSVETCSKEDAIYVDIESFEELEKACDGLKAQVEQLQVMFIELRDYHVCNLRTDSPFIGRVGVHENWFKLSQIIDATPAQCLAARDAETKAQAVEEAIRNGITVDLVHYTIEQYANQLRQQVRSDE